MTVVNQAMIKTYLDTNVLIAAFHSDRPSAKAAMRVMDDPRRAFMASQYLRMETLRKPMFYRREDEMEFMDTYFSAVSQWIPTDDDLVAKALELATQFDLGSMDALHAASALRGSAEEFVTMERHSKPLCRVPGLRVVSLHPLVELMS
ncbi:PIN domain-containing protein [Gammaproteobacteria bacterium]